MVCEREAETTEVDEDVVREFETSASVGIVDSVSDEPVDEEVTALLVVTMMLLDFYGLCWVRTASQAF